MTDKLTVTVVIPTRGRPELARALASAVHQTLPPDEIVVVSDETAAVFGPDAIAMLRTHPDRPASAGVTLHAVHNDTGLSGARQIGVDRATSRLIAFLDDDDEWLPGKLDAQVERYRSELDHVRFPVVTAQSIDVTPAGDVIYMPPPLDYDPDTDVLGDALFRCASPVTGRPRLKFGASTFLCSAALLANEPMRAGMNLHEDWEWPLRVDRLDDARASVVREPLVRYRVNPAGVSASRPDGGWWESVRFGLDTPMSNEARGDFLLTVSASLAVDGGSRRTGLMIARTAFREGSPGRAAVITFVLRFLIPARARPPLARLAALSGRLRRRPT